MDLELATTRDMIEELRRRAVRFVFVGVPPTNRTGREDDVWIAGQGRSSRDLADLMRVGCDRFEKLYGDGERS